MIYLMFHLAHEFFYLAPTTRGDGVLPLRTYRHFESKLAFVQIGILESSIEARTAMIEEVSELLALDIPAPLCEDLEIIVSERIPAESFNPSGWPELTSDERRAVTRVAFSL